MPAPAVAPVDPAVADPAGPEVFPATTDPAAPAVDAAPVDPAPGPVDAGPAVLAAGVAVAAHPATTMAISAAAARSVMDVIAGGRPFSLAARLRSVPGFILLFILIRCATGRAAGPVHCHRPILRSRAARG